MLSVKLRLTGFQNSFHDLKIELLEGICIAIILLPVTFYFNSIRFYIDIRILIDSATFELRFLMILPLRGLPAVFSITISSDRTFFKNIQFLTPTKFVERHFMLPNEMKGSLLQRIIDIAIQSVHKVT